MNCANHPERERAAFCQNCGKPLCQECTRVIGTAVFCESCLAARLAGVPQNASAGAYAYSSPSDGVNSVVDGFAPPPRVPGAPSPGLATLLGFIPGVGAMYNGQYAKGVVHLTVFAILVSLSNNVSPIFGMFIAGWVIYQAIEANHTARARLLGTPLPNPFGLNDLGERLGFGKSWPMPGHVPSAETAYNPEAAATTSTPPPASAYPPYTPPASNWGAPAEGFNYGAPPASPVPPYAQAPFYTAPFIPVDPYADPTLNSVPRNRFPTGAIWLIGLGLFFLIGNSGLLRGFPFRHVAPFLLIGLGVWLFIRKMTYTGASFADDGTPGYRLRVFRALRGSIWVILSGITFLLADFNILSWGRSWPLFIIGAGLITLLERSAFSNAAFAGYPYQQSVTPASTPAADSAASGTPASEAASSTPTSSPTTTTQHADRNQEGS